MLAGMTPTTSYNGLELVEAAANGGFHVELAAGGLSRSAMFRSKLEELCQKLNPGVGIVINCIYINPKQWAFQFPLIVSMIREGFPIESLTIAAGFLLRRGRKKL